MFRQTLKAIKASLWNDIGLILIFIHIIGLFLFFYTWSHMVGFGLLREKNLWFIPIGSYLFYSFFHLISEGYLFSVIPQSLNPTENIKEINDAALKLLPVLSVVTAIPLLIKDGGFPYKSFQLASLAFIYLFIGVVPLIWIENLKALMIIRCVKSIAYHQGLSWLIASGISAGFWLRIL